jgi:hypothetical protein
MRIAKVSGRFVVEPETAEEETSLTDLAERLQTVAVTTAHACLASHSPLPDQSQRTASSMG